MAISGNNFQMLPLTKLKSGEVVEELPLSLETPHTIAQIPACIIIFKNLRQEDELIKATIVILKMRRRRMKREAKPMNNNVARVNKKLSLCHRRAIGQNILFKTFNYLYSFN